MDYSVVGIDVSVLINNAYRIYGIWIGSAAVINTLIPCLGIIGNAFVELPRYLAGSQLSDADLLDVCHGSVAVIVVNGIVIIGIGVFTEGACNRAAASVIDADSTHIARIG